MSGLSCSTRCTWGQARRTCTYIWQGGCLSTALKLVQSLENCFSIAKLCSLNQFLSYKKFKVEVEKVVGEVHIGDGNKAMTATSVIAGLVGSQRATKSLQKKLESDNSPVPTRSKSKSLRMRGSSSDSHGVAKGNKGNRRSFAVMHSSLDSSIWFLLWFKFEIGNTHS